MKLLNRTSLSEHTNRACYVCGQRGNPIIAEEPCERRFGRPFIPEGVYRLARCGSCGTLYVDSNVTDSYLNDFYALETEESVHELDPTVSRITMMALRLPEFKYHWSHIKTYREPSCGDRLLDMGCQTGEFGDIVAQDDVIPCGTELSAEYAQTCRAKWGSSSIVHAGNLVNAPFNPGQFQYITAFETLEHVCDPVVELRRLREWLSADGIFAMSVPASDYFHLKYWMLIKQPLAGPLRRFVAKRSKSIENKILPSSHIFSFTPKSLDILLRRASFEPLEVGLTGWHSKIPRIMVLVGDALAKLSNGRIAIAPSIFAVARRASTV